MLIHIYNILPVVLYGLDIPSREKIHKTLLENLKGRELGDIVMHGRIT
jgi:hypothetical protein